MSEGSLFSQIFRWDGLSAFIDNGVVKLAATIPLIGYLILLNDEIVASTTFHEIAGYREGDRSPFFIEGIAKLRLSFFGSIFLLGAFVLFRISSPRAALVSVDDRQHAERVLNLYNALEIRALEQEVLSTMVPKRLFLMNPKELNEFRLASTLEPRLQGVTQKSDLLRSYREYISFVAREWWLHKVNSRIYCRIPIFSIAVAGYSMMLLPTSDVIQAVLRDILT